MMKSSEIDVSIDLDLLVDSLKKSVSTTCDDSFKLATDHYLCAFNQLIRIFKVFGYGPSQPLKDVPRAVKALEIRRVSGGGSYYRRLSSMLQHEKNEGVQLGSIHLMSGTAALALLHDALKYMTAFLKYFSTAVDSKGRFTSRQKLRAYSQTIGKHHSVMTRFADKFALMNSPSANQLLKKFSQYCHGDSSADGILREIVCAMESLQQETDKIISDLGRQPAP